MLVEVALFDESLLHSLSQYHEYLSAFQIRAVEYRIDRGGKSVSMSLMLTFVKEIVDGIAVGHDKTVVPPLVTQDINQQAVARAAGLALETLVGAHHLSHVGLLDECLECRKISLPQVAVGGFDVHGVAQRLGAAVDGIVLGTGMGLEIAAVVALHAEDGLYAQYGVHVGILAAGLLAAPPAGITEDVDVRAPEGELWIARIIDHAHGDIEQLGVVVVSTVPVGACLVAHSRKHVVDQLLAEGCCHTDRLGENRISALAHAMTGFAPPVVRRNAETVDGDTLVHHQADFLFGREHGNEVFHAFGSRQLRILPRVLVLRRSQTELGHQHRQKEDSFHLKIVLIS